MRRRTILLLGSIAAALICSKAAWAGNGGLLPPAPHSPNAHRIRDAYVFVLVFVLIIFVLVEGTLVAFVVRYRRGRRAATLEGPQIHGAKRLEIMWTVVPALILAAIAAFVFVELPGITGPPAAAAGDETTITIEGHQFYWLFRYPNGAVSLGTMYAPANEVVHESVFAPKDDVVHSWWVPNLAGQIDAVPGQVNHSWFEAPAGTYVARCALLCGIQHTDMLAHVKVVPRAQYEQFIAKRKAQATGIALGREEYEYACATCHRLHTIYVGPALAGNPLLHNVKGITTTIRQGFGTMPAVASDWSSTQIKALIAYTKTIKAPSPNG